jgi:serine/threonine-protein kinase
MNETTRELFTQEAEMVAVLSHPNIVPIFEMGEADDCYYQVIQLVKGEDLDSIIKRKAKNPLPGQRTLAPDECISIICQVLDGLGYAHDEGVVHQDIKPPNVLIEQRSRRPLIADFGIAKTAQSEIREEGTIVGSPLYMAPEHVASQTTDARSDIYSVGIMLYQMLAGDLPIIDREPMALLIRKIEAPDTLFSCSPSRATKAIDHALERIILRAIAANPDDRYESCALFNRELSEYAATHLDG